MSLTSALVSNNVVIWPCRVFHFFFQHSLLSQFHSCMDILLLLVLIACSMWSKLWLHIPSHKRLGTISSFPSITALAAVFTNTEILWVAKTWEQGSRLAKQVIKMWRWGWLPQTRANNMWILLELQSSKSVFPFYFQFPAFPYPGLFSLFCMWFLCCLWTLTWYTGKHFIDFHEWIKSGLWLISLVVGYGLLYHADVCLVDETLYLQLSNLTHVQN